jgi:hypothetical protein
MNLKRFLVVVFAFLVVLSLGSTRLAAQTSTTGDVTGVVTDPSNAVVPDAKVNLKDNSKGNTQDTKTSKDGGFHFYLLSPGSYTLNVSAAGFQVQSRQVQVAVGQIFTADVQLSLGASTQTVTVTEAAPLIQTENGDTASAMSEQQVQNVPNPGNDLSAIAQLAPGVVMNTQGGFGNVEAFGLPATSNLFTMNGMDDNDPFLNLNNSGATNLLLGSNEIQEADVVTNGYSSSYGTFAGINVNYITKSGGNDFHGNAVYYWNGRAMNANDWFNKANGLPRAFDNANQWAASIGGPIKKDKLFFFFNTEGLRVLIPVPSTVFVPTAAFEGATVENLTALGLQNSIPYYCQTIGVTAPDGKSFTCPSGLPGSGNGMFNLFNGAKGNPTSTVDNLPPGQVVLANGDIGNTGDGCDNVTALGVIDTGVKAPTAVRSTSRFGSMPRPAGVATGSTQPCAVSLRTTPVNFAPEKQVAGRGDWNVGPNDRAYVRMQYDQGIQPTFTDALLPIFNDASNQPEYQGQLNETHIFSPTLSNQFLLAATWYSAIFGPANLNATLNAFPTTVLLGDGTLGNPNNSSIAVGGIDFAFPQGRNVTQFQLGDDVSKSFGNHTFKFGAKYHKNYVSDHDFGNRVSGLQIPFSLGDFFNGGGASELQQNFAAAPNQPVRLYEVAGYIQDEWRVRPNLTITPALRLEHASDPTCVTLCFAQLSESVAAVSAAEATAVANETAPPPYSAAFPGGIIQSGRRQALLGFQNLQWEPRVSFAWQPFGSTTGRLKSDLVVRGGAGIFYDIFPGAISDNMAQNAPLFNPFTVLSNSADALFGLPPSGCAGFLSPNQAGNLFSCTSAANSAFLNAFNTGSGTVNSVPGITITDPKTQAPQFQKWSLEIQKGFGPNNSIDVGYYGNHGIHIPVFNNSINGFGFGTLPATATLSQFTEVQDVQSAGVSNYNGLVASFKHRFSGWEGSGVFQLNYTYSKAMDDVSNGGFFGFTGQSILFPENPANVKQNYGPADYDVRNSVNGNYVWELPIRKALMGHGWAPLVDGWQVSGAIFFRTGLPWTAIDGALDSQLNGSNYFAAVFPTPLVGSALGTRCNSEKFAGPNAVPCLTVSTQNTPGDFPIPTSEGGFGPQGLRNAYRGPSYFDTDFSFTKRTKIPGWERGELQLGLQFFNVLNHPNFNLPVNDISSGAFGKILSPVNPPTSILGSFLGGDASPRLIQLKAQLVF